MAALNRRTRTAVYCCASTLRHSCTRLTSRSRIHISSTKGVAAQADSSSSRYCSRYSPLLLFPPRLPLPRLLCHRLFERSYTSSSHATCQSTPNLSRWRRASCTISLLGSRLTRTGGRARIVSSQLSTFFRRTPHTKRSSCCHCSRTRASIASYVLGIATRGDGLRCSLPIYTTRIYTPLNCSRMPTRFSSPRPGCILVLCRTTFAPRSRRHCPIF